MIRKFPDLQKKTNITLSKHEDEFGFNLIYEIKYVSKLGIEAVINELLKNDQIEYAEPSYVHRIDYNPNDPYYLGGAQSYLQQVKAPAAWDIIRNASNIIIGIVDTGSDLDHPDLAANIYLNVADPINGLDDDNDGYVDNYRGWDMTGTSYVYGSKGDNDPNVKSVDNDHGVHVSGIASAVSNNNTGVASIANNAKLLIVKCGADNEYKSLIYNGYEGILYAVNHGAKVINCSWGGNNYSNFGQSVINYAISKDCLIIASAGNDNDPYKHYPSSYSGVICVANVDQNDRKNSSSNYGADVSISAPGSSIYNTIFNNGYGYKTGTSMASPLVASAAALVKSYYPSYTMKQIGELLIATADNIDNKNPYYVGELGSGRLNVFKALGGRDLYPQVISFTMPLVKTYGDADFDPGATSSSGLLVTYSSANPNIATIVNNKIHIIGAGSVIITASQVGNNSFLTAPTVGRTLIVAKSSQTIAFPNIVNKNYGNTDFDPGASSTSGLPINYTSSDTDIATIINNKVHITGIGTTTLTASQAGNTNYNSALSVKNTLTVVYPLPINNFKIQASDKTCRATNNGTIVINTVQPLNYIVSVKSINQTTFYNFNNVLEIKDLSAGNYSVCITILSVNNYKQCFDLTIREPKDLSVYANVSDDNKLVNLQLQGGTFYKIEMNGKTFTTNEYEIALPLINGTNKLKITTNALCQGTVEKTFITNHKIIAYPNPFSNSLSISTGTMDNEKINVQVYTPTGLLVYSDNHQNQMGKIDLDLSRLSIGLYILRVNIGNTQSTHKMIKN
ncbi:MAG: S8 family serine peptidase [Bacteroidota bacterium]